MERSFQDGFAELALAIRLGTIIGYSDMGAQELSFSSLRMITT
jgi:hypothetical protein